MIRPLRQLHRRVFIALGILLPMALVVGIAARKPTPVVAELPAALAAGSPTFAATEWERDGLFPKSPVQVRLLREQKNSGRFALALIAAKDFVKPDLIQCRHPAARGPDEVGRGPSVGHRRPHLRGHGGAELKSNSVP